MRSWLFVFLLACGGGNKPAPQPPQKPDVPAKTPTVTPPVAPPVTPPVAKSDPNNCKDTACVIDAMDAFSKQMCACKDKDCVDKVNESLTKWGQVISEKPELANIKPSGADAKRATDVMMKYSECMTKRLNPPSGNGLGGGVP